MRATPSPPPRHGKRKERVPQPAGRNPHQTGARRRAGPETVGGAAAAGCRIHPPCRFTQHPWDPCNPWLPFPNPGSFRNSLTVSLTVRAGAPLGWQSVDHENPARDRRRRAGAGPPVGRTSRRARRSSWHGRRRDGGRDELAGEAGCSYFVEGSPDLLDWRYFNSARATRPGTGSLKFACPAARYFVRLRTTFEPTGASGDPDGDGLSTGFELAHSMATGLSPLEADSDKDGVLDGHADRTATASPTCWNNSSAEPGRRGQRRRRGRRRPRRLGLRWDRPPNTPPAPTPPTRTPTATGCPTAGRAAGASTRWMAPTPPATRTRTA